MIKFMYSLPLSFENRMLSLMLIQNGLCVFVFLEEGHPNNETVRYSR